MKQRLYGLTVTYLRKRRCGIRVKGMKYISYFAVYKKWIQKAKDISRNSNHNKI